MHIRNALVNHVTARCKWPLAGGQTLRYVNAAIATGTATATDQQHRRYSTPAYYQQIGKTPLIYRNLGQQLLRAVERFGQRPAVVSCHEDKRLSYEEARDVAERLAVALAGLGLQRGEHLGIWSANSIQWYVTFLAAALGGFPLVCINPALQATELEHALRKAKVSALVMSDVCGAQNFHQVLDEVLALTRASQQQLPLRHVLVQTSRVDGDSTTEGHHNYDAMLAKPSRTQSLALLRYKVADIQPESPCNIQFTSGTTGQPKAALLTHFNYVNTGHYMGLTLELDKAPKNICLTVPTFHAFGLSVMVAGLEYGATLVLPSARFDSTRALDAVEREQCHVILGTPTMYVDMVEQQGKLKRDLHTLELGLVGGAPCTPQVYRDTKTVLGLKHFRIGYGLSEATAAVFAQNGEEELGSTTSTVGTIYEHGEAKVVDDKGETVKSGQAGELCVRGYFTMRGYFADEEQTRAAIVEGGWLRTGDEFILDAVSGLGRIVGRKKDIIIRGGENIFPKEIEDFLESHGDILEAQVIGVPDERVGEEICAFIRLKPGVKDLSAAAVKTYCHSRIAHFKIPRYVRVIGEFPKTNTGKIQKFKLQEMFRAD